MQVTAVEKTTVTAKSLIQVIQDKSNRKEVGLKTVAIILFLVDLWLVALVIKNGGSLFNSG